MERLPAEPAIKMCCERGQTLPGVCSKHSVPLTPSPLPTLLEMEFSALLAGSGFILQDEVWYLMCQHLSVIPLQFLLQEFTLLAGDGGASADLSNSW